MFLCTRCSAVDIRALLINAIRPPQEYYSSQITLYDSIQDLLDGSQSGCSLCSLISNEVDWKFQLNRAEGLGGVRDLTFRVYASNEEKASAHLSGFGFVTNLEFFPMPGFDFTDDDDILAVLSRFVYPSTGSPQTLQYASQWLQRCKASHSSCSRGDSRRLPTRVIAVGSGTQIPRLIDTGTAEGCWVALSYCWGRDADFMLTSASKDHLERGVALEAFPPTLRDAVIVTRELGIPYLWIDALCIIQDSVEDWQKEAAQMKTIYSNAELVIAAMSTDDVNSAIFHSRSVPSATLPWMRRKASAISKSDQDAKIGVRKKLDESTSDENRLFTLSRWMSRAWTLQEDFLARRLLLFTKETMTWERLEHAERESGQHIITINNSNRPDKRNFMSRYWKRWMAALGELSADNTDSSVTLEYLNGNKAWEDILDWAGCTPYQMWNITAMEYNKRRLTKISDRLPALSGLAALFHEIVADEYFSGLWKNDMLRGLLWQFATHQPSARELIPYKWTPPAREAYVEQDIELTDNGPSWSWASVNGDILELKIPLDIPKPGKNGVEPRILDVQTFFAAGNDPFGSVLGSELTVEADSVEWFDSYTEQTQSKLQQFVTELLGQPERRNQRGFYAEYRLRHQAHPRQVTAALLFGFGATHDFGYSNGDGASVMLIESIRQPLSEDQQGRVKPPQDRLLYRRVGKIDIRWPSQHYTTLALTDIRYQSLLEIEAYQECVRGFPRKTYTVV